MSVYGIKSLGVYFGAIFLVQVGLINSIYASIDVPSSCLSSWTSIDYDNDGISDQVENCLANKHAPVLYLHSDENEFPSSVDWYLQRVNLRFNHDNGCGDEYVAGGPLPSGMLPNFQHQKMTKNALWYPPFYECVHTSSIVSSNLLNSNSWTTDHHFFMQPPSADTHRGDFNNQNWKVYSHSYPSGSGIVIEYWYFFPYNTTDYSSVNHEGDWEHITVKLNGDMNIDLIEYHYHGEDPLVYTANDPQITWFKGLRGGHPNVFIALGTHASYVDIANCNSYEEHGHTDECNGDPTKRWITWAGGKGDYYPGKQGYGVVPLGETNNPYSNYWLLYSGRWGKPGSDIAVTPFGTLPTAGPRGPATKLDRWGVRKVMPNGYVVTDGNLSFGGGSDISAMNLDIYVYDVAANSTMTFYAGNAVTISGPHFLVEDGATLTVSAP